MRRSGTDFVHAGTVVSAKSSSHGVAILVRGAHAPLSTIRLQWKHEMPPNALVLADHWERSYGDLQWRPSAEVARSPWYMLVEDGNQTACFGVRTGAAGICSWTFDRSHLELHIDVRSGGVGVHLGDRVLHIADVITTRSASGETSFATATRFCEMMCVKPRLPRQPVYGINDWYFAYGKNSADLIRETTARMSELVTDHDNKPFSVIDAGWAKYAPGLVGDGGWNDDFSVPNEKFPDMHALADNIKKTGMRPGLWMRPLCARHDEKQSLLLPKIKGRDNPANPILDPTIPENIHRIRQYFKVYHDWGFEMIKHDFTTFDLTGRWGFDMKDSVTQDGWRFHDNSRTTAEIVLDLYRNIRSAAGDDMYIIGCNTLSHLSAGLFELCRIGDDTSGKDWSRTRKMGVNTLAFRLPQHNRFYAADGDCVGLTTNISWERNRQWLQLLAESGAPLFISAQPEAVGSEQKAAIKTAFAQAARKQPLGEPLDWKQNMQPARWKLNERVVEFDWS